MEIPTVIRPPTKALDGIATNPIVEDAARYASDVGRREALRAQWTADIEGDADAETLLERNIIVEAMKQSGLRPDPDSFDAHERAMGLYPDVADPEFASKLVRKQEFSQLASKASSEDTCALLQDEFEATAIQRLVARFLHPTTPYRSLLLNHGVGVGKTCSAITVAETYLEALPGNTVYIVAPQAIAEGFEKTIFDVNKLVPTGPEERALTGELWKSPQCTGMTYLRLTDMAGHKSKEEIDKEVQKLIRTRYTIMGYRKFANMIDRRFAAIPKEIKGEARKDRETSLLMDMFSDHLVIVDEAHNLRDAKADAALERESELEVEDADATQAKEEAVLASAGLEGRLLTPFLLRMASVAEGMRLLLMTATPMYNAAPEIVFLLNLLHINDTNDDKAPLLLSESDYVKSTGRFTAAGEAKLIKLIKRYVSYMRGENPNTFPLRLTPPESWGATLLRTHPEAGTPGPLVVAAYPQHSISREVGGAGPRRITLPPEDAEIMGALPLIVHTVGEAPLLGSRVAEVLSDTVESYRKAAGRSAEFVLEKTIQIANMTYPDGKYGNHGWPVYWKKVRTNVRGTECAQFSWSDKDTKPEDVLAGAALAAHAPKIASIVDHLTRADKGISFIFSRYILAGALPVAMALELAGWCRVLADGTPAPLLAGNKSVKGPFYVLLTSNEELSPNFQGLLRYANAPENAQGAKVRAILGSQITSEGLDLKCVRQLHILDGWYHLNRIEQVEGRGVRFCSHSRLPLASRNCLIYLHAVHHPEFETGDFHAYRIAAGKARPIGRVTRLIKLHAWDCILNRAAIMLEGLGDRRVEPVLGAVIAAYELKDHAFTSFCDFSQECEYICSAKAVPAAEVGKNVSTYKEFDFRYQFLKLHERFLEAFSHDVAVPLSVIKRGIYKDIPWSIAATGLREILGTLRIRRPDGLYGTLVLKGDHVVFQPEDVTDTEIPLTYRYGRAYRRIPRTMIPSRHTVLAALAAPPVGTKVAVATATATATAAAAEEAVDEEALAAAALKSLSEWRALVRDHLMKEPHGALKRPAQFENDIEFNAWRWLIYHFRTLRETELTACRWWMDSKWSPAARLAVLKRWYSVAPAGDEVEYRALLTSDTYDGAVKGFLAVQEGKLRTFCVPPGDTITENCIAYKASIDKALPPVVKRYTKTEMGDLYGMMSPEGSAAVFKTVHIGVGTLHGAFCANATNTSQSLPRIQIIQAAARALCEKEDPLLSLLLDDTHIKMPPEDAGDNKARKSAVADRYIPGKKQSALTLTKIYDLSKAQWCPYMEFLLRIMDSKRVGGRRWFLSLVEHARAAVKP